MVFLEEIYRLGERKSGIRYRVKTKDGDWRWHTSNASPIKDSAGNITGYVGVASDITEIVNAENESALLRKQLQDQNDSLQNFAFIVGHDLKSHSHNLDFIYSSLKKSETSIQQHKHFHIFEKAIKSLNKTTANLNELVKSHTLNGKLIPTMVDLAETTKNVLDTVSSNISTDDYISIINRLPESNLYISSISAYTDSIVLNLITNAIKYRKPEQKCVIEFYYSTTEKGVRFSIKDNGIGIDLASHKKSLFKLFKTFTKDEDFTGIGLYIVKQQVEAVGGKIHVESELGLGSVFHVDFESPKND